LIRCGKYRYPSAEDLEDLSDEELLIHGFHVERERTKRGLAPDSGVAGVLGSVRTVNTDARAEQPQDHETSTSQALVTTRNGNKAVVVCNYS
jgi:hypothetical protein